MSDNIVELEGKSTPNILLNEGEQVLMDLSQGFRDLGIVGLLFRHKGRLIVTNQRAIYFKKKTKDYDIEQMNIRHAGYVKMGHRLDFGQLVGGIGLLAFSVGAFSAGQAMVGVGVIFAALIVILLAKKQGLFLSGSGEKIAFETKSVPATELSKIITVVSANS